MFTLAVFVKVS